MPRDNMQLLYIHIDRFKCLHDIGLSFSPHYRIAYDPASGILSIERNENTSHYPDSITAIVGGNGAGKSTALHWLLEALAEGSGTRRPEGIIVWAEGEGDEDRGYAPKIHAYMAEGREVSTPGIVPTIHHRPPNTDIIYYSGHFSPAAAPMTLSHEVAGEYNLSDINMLVKDITGYANEDGLHGALPLGRYLGAHRIQNAYRIAHMLADRRLSRMLDGFMRLPQYIVVTPNRSGASLMERIPPHVTHENPTDDLARQFIENGLINMATESNRRAPSLKLLEQWNRCKPRKGESVAERFARFAESKGNETLEILSHTIRTLFDICHLDTLSGQLYVTVSEAEQLNRLSATLFHEPIFLSARFFDIRYEIAPWESRTILSSGETEMLNMLSRIYWCMTMETVKFKNLKKPGLILLDEAEIGFHPEWQRKYVAILERFSGYFGRRFQIVYTTHSPISLSDMPRSCVNFLEVIRDADGQPHTVNVRDSMPETFGTNIFELYRNSFFMKDGMIGERAARYIQQIDADIESGRASDYLETQRRIAMIGDRRIRTYLTDRLSTLRPAPDINARIAEMERELEILRAERQRMEGRDDV